MRLLRGWTAEKAAALMGISRGQFIKLERGERKLTERTIALAAKAFEVTKAEVMNERSGRALGEETINHRHEKPIAAAIDVPEIDVRAGASYAGGFGEVETVSDGGQVISRDSIRANWSIPQFFLRDELGMQPGHVHILSVRGDSMETTLFDGDRALINLQDTDVSQGGIFAILDDNGSVIIKQVELIRGHDPRRIRCKSRNSNYEPFELTLIEPVKIIGRVACRITRL